MILGQVIYLPVLYLKNDFLNPTNKSKAKMILIIISITYKNTFVNYENYFVP